MPENDLERVREVVGSDALPDLTELDRTNELHLDRAGVVLLRRFKEADDVVAFQLLIDLVTGRLADIAQGIVREQGLLEDPDQLVVDYLADLFVDVRPPDQSTTFLAMAAAGMQELAETRVRDIALTSVYDPQAAVVWEDDGAAPRIGETDLERRAARICHHRLDLPYRRVLRAMRVDELQPAEIAEQMGLPAAEVGPLLKTAEDRLDAAMERAIQGDSP